VASAETGTAAEVKIRIAASPETVFDFFTDPDKMIQWMGRSAELDPRSGGTFRCDINGRDVARGEYVELDRPNRVVFTWGWEGEEPTIAPGGSTVEVLLVPDGEGTQLRLVHRDLPNPESAERHGQGWRHYTERLTAVASGGDPGADPWQSPDAVEVGDKT
jgi:uncharacterized protein YndB with AHSA1/START domain